MRDPNPDMEKARRMPRTPLADTVAKVVAGVEWFDRVFDIEPAQTDDEEATLFYLRDRLPMLIEEVGEYAKALNNDNLDNAAYNLGDMLFVILETINILNKYALSRVARVVASNLAKSPNTHVLNTSKTKLIPREISL